jgi:hypothetical protein
MVDYYDDDVDAEREALILIAFTAASVSFMAIRMIKSVRSAAMIRHASMKKIIFLSER